LQTSIYGKLRLKQTQIFCYKLLITPQKNIKIILKNYVVKNVFIFG